MPTRKELNEVGLNKTQTGPEYARDWVARLGEQISIIDELVARDRSIDKEIASRGTILRFITEDVANPLFFAMPRIKERGVKTKKDLVFIRSGIEQTWCALTLAIETFGERLPETSLPRIKQLIDGQRESVERIILGEEEDMGIISESAEKLRSTLRIDFYQLPGFQATDIDDSRRLLGNYRG